MGASLFKGRPVGVLTGERLDRRLPSAAEPTGDEKHYDLVDLPLGAVQGAEHIRLAEPEPLGDAASAELVALDEAVHGALARIQLAQAVVDASRVRCGDRGLFNALGRVVADDVLEEFADRQLAASRGFPEVPRPEAESGPQCAPQMLLGGELPRPQDECDVLELVLAFDRARATPQLTARHLTQDRGTPTL